MSIQQSEAICKQCGEEIKMDGLEPAWICGYLATCFSKQKRRAYPFENME